MAQKDMFGRWLPYKSPSIAGYEDDIESFINAIADNVLAVLSPEEALKNLNDYTAVQTYIVNEVNKILKDSQINTKVDGTTVAPILKKIISERKALLEAYFASLEPPVSGE